MIKTLNNMSRTLLFHAYVPTQYWGESLESATYLVNLLPTKPLYNIPHAEVLFRITPSIFDFFGIYVFRIQKPLLNTN